MIRPVRPQPVGYGPTLGPRNRRMRLRMQRTRRISPAATALFVACVALTGPAVATAATLDVAVERDPGLAGNHRCSLREAIAAVNSPGVRTPCGRAGRSSNTIILRAGRYRLSVRPSDTDDNRSGDLNITRARQPDHRRRRQREDGDRCVRAQRSGAVDHQRGDGHAEQAGDSRRPRAERDRRHSRSRCPDLRARFGSERRR